MTSVIRTMTEVGGWVWPSRIPFVLKSADASHLRLAQCTDFQCDYSMATGKQRVLKRLMTLG